MQEFAAIPDGVDFPEFVFDGDIEIVHQSQKDLPDTVRVVTDDGYTISIFVTGKRKPLDTIDIRKFVNNELDMKLAWHKFKSWVESHKRVNTKKAWRCRYNDNVIFMFDRKTFLAKIGGNKT